MECEAANETLSEYSARTPKQAAGADPVAQMLSASAQQQAEVPAELDGVRLDAAAAQLFPDYSRARLRLWIEGGRMLHNGQATARGRQPVRAGDRLQLDPDDAALESRVVAQPIDIEVLYADAALAIIDKPPGLTVHPGAGTPDGTLQNALLHRFPQTAAVPRAGLVHRLDKNTSGLLVVALDLRAHTRLVAALARREIRREYDALVVGAVTAGNTVDAPIGRDPRHRTRMAVTEGGRRAVTHYSVVERFERLTLLRVQLETGRTHQIRVHLAHLRHPIVGDSVYGSRRRSGVAAADAFPRQALHARRLSFAHPLSATPLQFEAPLPDDLQSLLRVLREAEPPHA